MLSFFLFQPQDTGFHGQDKVYGDLGEEMLEHSFEGKHNGQAKELRASNSGSPLSNLWNAW